MDDVTGTEGTEVEAPEGQTEGANGDQGSQQQAAAEEAFFDATKVAALDPRLVPSYREMQAAFTKRTQEFAPYREFEKAYGSLENARTLIDAMRDPNQAVELWASMGERWGLTRQQMAGLFQAAQNGGQVAPQGQQTQQVDPNQPLTVAQFQQYMAQQQQQQVAAQEDAQVKDLLAPLRLTPVAQRAVLTLAEAQPRHLGYSERIKRGHAEYKAELDRYAAEVQGRNQQNSASAPRSLAGTMPAPGGPEAPRTLQDAFERAKARLANDA